ncbi:glycosyltransferase family 4 protein [Candidatus Bathyarchaeota archaeon]|nr:glycosyltransferase family 4 protein [Candidatus Bathyarchaeota archaeon]
MKIALCSDWVYPTVGGVQSHIIGLTTNLIKNGHEVIIISKEQSEKEPKSSPYDRSVKEIRTKTVAPIKHVIMPPQADELEKILRNEKVDIVHGHHAFTPTALMSIDIAKKQGIPTVLTNHSISVANSYDMVWDLMSQVLFPVKGYVKQADRVIAVSHAAAEFIERFMDDKKAIVIPNGVDIERFSKPLSPDSQVLKKIPTDCPKILAVGRLSFRKGFHLLIEAMPRILKDSPKTQLIVAGKGYMMRYLKTFTEGLGLKNNIKFLGYVPDDSLPWLYNNCDIFTLPSLSAESFGITVIEAMAASKPVVASRMGGVPEIIDDNINGMLFQPWDSYELSEKIVKLLANMDYARALGKQAFNDAVQKYDWRVVTHQIEKVYEEIA